MRSKLCADTTEVVNECTLISRSSWQLQNRYLPELEWSVEILRLTVSHCTRTVAS